MANQSGTNFERLHLSELDTASLTWEAGFDAWRRSLAPLFEAELVGAPTSVLLAGNRAYLLEDCVFAESWCRVGMLWHAAPRRPLASDPLVLTLHGAGVTTALNGGRDLSASPGDISLADLAAGYDARDEGYRALALVLPRHRLLRQMSERPAACASVISGATAPGFILASHMRAAWRAMPAVRPEEAPLVLDALIGVVAKTFEHVFSISAGESAGALLTPTVIWDYIERHLDVPDLGPERLCHVFGCSRSRLYRLFRPHGGVRRYLRERRLQRCYLELRAPSAAGNVIGPIAARYGFSSQSHFCRLFKHRFGMTPSEVRAHPGRSLLSFVRGSKTPDYTAWLASMRN